MKLPSEPIVHVTRIDAMTGAVYGHKAETCDPSGCAGHEYWLRNLRADEVMRGDARGEITGELDELDPECSTYRRRSRTRG